MMSCSFRMSWPVIALAAFRNLVGPLWLPLAGAAVPIDNPLKKYDLKWNEDVAWTKVIDVTTMSGLTSDERFEGSRFPKSRSPWPIQTVPR